MAVSARLHGALLLTNPASAESCKLLVCCFPNVDGFVLPMPQPEKRDSGIRILKGKSLQPIADYVDGLSDEDWRINSFGNEFELLVDKLANTFDHCMFRRNLASVLYLTILEFQVEQISAAGQTTVADGPTPRRRLIDKMKASLENYPRPFEVRLNLPSFRESQRLVRIDIVPDMWLEFTSQFGEKKSWALVLSGKGYLDGQLDSPLGIKILSKAKLFVFFMRSLNLINFAPYSKRAEGELKDLRMPKEQREKIVMPNGLAQCFGGLTLHLGTLLRPRGDERDLNLFVLFDNLQDAIRRMPALLSASERDDSITAAIEWYEDSHFVDNETVALLEVCIGFEALLQDEDHLNEMTNRLCDRLAFTLARTRQERAELFKSYRAILALRGQLVHSKQARLHDSDRELLHRARSMLVRLIQSELALVAG